MNLIKPVVHELIAIEISRQAQLKLWCNGCSSWKVIRICGAKNPTFAKILFVKLT